MGIFDGIFNTKPQQAAANAQIAGLNQGAIEATGAINTGQTTTNADYAAGLTPFLTNLSTDQAGQTNYADALGVNGQQGYDRAVQSFHTGPGYQFALDQGNQNVLRNKSQTGQLASGGTNIDLLKYGQGLADQQWQQYLTNLLPFVGASTQNAGGVASTDVAKASTDAGYAGKLADLAWSKNTGIGNANANADLAQSGANANIVNFGLNAAKSLAGFIPA